MSITIITMESEFTDLNSSWRRHPGDFWFSQNVRVKATHWSTNGDITDAHISATIQRILTKFSAVVSYVKQRQIGKFQLICTWVTMLSKYIICDLLPQKQAELAHSGFALAAKTFSWGSLRQTCDFSGTGLYDI